MCPAEHIHLSVDNLHGIVVDTVIMIWPSTLAHGLQLHPFFSHQIKVIECAGTGEKVGAVIVNTHRAMRKVEVRIRRMRDRREAVPCVEVFKVDKHEIAMVWTLESFLPCQDVESAYSVR